MRMTMYVRGGLGALGVPGSSFEGPAVVVEVPAGPFAIKPTQPMLVPAGTTSCPGRLLSVTTIVRDVPAGSLHVSAGDC